MNLGLFKIWTFPLINDRSYFYNIDISQKHHKGGRKQTPSDFRKQPKLFLYPNLNNQCVCVHIHIYIFVQYLWIHNYIMSILNIWSLYISGIGDPLSNRLTMLITLRTIWFMRSKRLSNSAKIQRTNNCKCFLLSHVNYVKA